MYVVYSQGFFDDIKIAIEDRLFDYYALADALHEDLDVIRGWSIQKLTGWRAYFLIKSEKEEEAIDQKTPKKHHSDRFS